MIIHQFETVSQPTIGIIMGMSVLIAHPLKICPNIHMKTHLLRRFCLINKYSDNFLVEQDYRLEKLKAVWNFTADTMPRTPAPDFFFIF